jgi:hypothetical protein
MTAPKRARRKKYFTAAEANATLPLLRSILRDVTELAADLKERHERLSRVEVPAGARAGDAYQEEIREMQAEFERGRERMQEYLQELHNLGVELKPPYTEGLVDFPCILDDHEVYLCWRLGEPEVAHWHEIDAGFAGRRKLTPAGTAKH